MMNYLHLLLTEITVDGQPSTKKAVLEILEEEAEEICPEAQTLADGQLAAINLQTKRLMLLTISGRRLFRSPLQQLHQLLQADVSNVLNVVITHHLTVVLINVIMMMIIMIMMMIIMIIVIIHKVNEV
jgi:hypothetical protein